MIDLARACHCAKGLRDPTRIDLMDSSSYRTYGTGFAFAPIQAFHARLLSVSPAGTEEPPFFNGLLGFNLSSASRLKTLNGPVALSSHRRFARFGYRLLAIGYGEAL
jgi:hypothetical protein